MKKSLLLLNALLFSASMFAANMNQDPSKGTDCELFLNPYIESELREVSGQSVFDAGSSVALYNAEKLPFAANTFDKAFSVNMSAAMPTTMHMLSQNETREIGLGAYFSEIGRVMKDGAKLVIAAPASYDVVFSDGSRPEEAVMQHIAYVLRQIGDNDDPELITHYLMDLEEVMRATFVYKDGYLQLVTNEKDLYVGQPVWCKIPDGVITSVYHSEEEHLVAIKRAGLTCEEIKRPCFFGKVKYDLWRASPHVCGKSLGEAYMNHHPFTLYYVVK